MLKKSSLNIWKFSQNGYIWRIVNADKNLIAGETRDLDKKHMFLFVLDISNGKPVLKNYKFEEKDYWITIEYADFNRIYMHRYENPELPYNSGIIAFDIKEKKSIWENKEYQFYFADKGILYASKQFFEEIKTYKLNPDNGEIIQELTYEESLILHELKYSNKSEIKNEIENYPSFYQKTDTNNEIGKFIEDEIYSKNIKGNVEFLIKDNYLIFNYYQYKKSNNLNKYQQILENTICLIDLQRERILHREIINSKSNHNVPDSFYIKDNVLIYLVERKEIKGIILKE